MGEFKVILATHEKALLEAWFDRMLAAYPEASRMYLGRVNKQFSNPVGANLYHCLESLLKALLEPEPDADRINEDIQMLMRVKAVQEVLPSQAVSFVPALKQVIGQVCAGEIHSGKIDLKELLSFYEQIDTVGLYAFDAYSESRDLIYEMRLAQIKESNDILVRANLVDQALDMSEFMQCASSADSGSGGCSGCNSAAGSGQDQLDIKKGV